MVPIIGSISLVLFLVLIVYLIFLFIKKRPKKKALILLLISFFIFVGAAIASPDPTKDAKSWVKINENKDIDEINKNYLKLTDSAIKDDINKQEANSDKSMFGKKVTAKGVVLSFEEGFDDKKPFILETTDGVKVRVSSKSDNAAVDIGETVEVRGELASRLDKDIYIRNSYVYIK